MDQERVLLHVRRFNQIGAECGVASLASLVNYFDPTIDYKHVRSFIDPLDNIIEDGIETFQQVKLLNNIGYKSITIVSHNEDLIDFSWAGKSKNEIILGMKKLRKQHIKDKFESGVIMIDGIIGRLEDSECDNNIIIDSEFHKHIKHSLKSGKPVLTSIQFNSFHKISKNYTGEATVYHSIVIRGFDNKGVFIVDSHNFDLRHWQFKKYQSGYYKVSWEKFLVNIPEDGDIIIVN